MEITVSEAQMAQEWQTHGLPGLLAEFIQPGDLVFDIGANIGRMTYSYLHLGARVISVEPQQSCLQELHAHYDGNERVTIVPLAVGAKPGTVRLSVSGLGSSIATVVREHYWQDDGPWPRQLLAKEEEIEQTTLGALIETYGIPRFIKIDVEGYERQVLAGLSQFVPLSFEFHPFFRAEACLCMQRVLELEPQAKFNHTLGESLHYASSVWLDIEGMVAVLDYLYAQHGTVYFGNIYARKGIT
jgi:FkbM family methyltransferase